MYVFDSAWRDIITSLGSEGSVCLELLSDSAVAFLEPDFNDSIAATAASSSGTKGSSSFSSEFTPTTTAVLRPGMTPFDDLVSGTRNGRGGEDPLGIYCASSSDFCESNETQL